MMVDIFSSFDDNNQVLFSMYFVNWVVAMLPVLTFDRRFFVAYPSWIQSGKKYRESSFNTQAISGQRLGVYAAIYCISLMNLTGLIPYVFSITSHLAMSFSLGLPLWLTVIISSMQHNLKGFIASFLPAGAPAALSPFLVIVEFVSIVIRPLTLSVRLMANMSAGHIVLTIVGSYFLVSPICLGLLQIFYTIFEMAIALIQSYIFALLVSLYLNDHSS